MYNVEITRQPNTKRLVITVDLSVEGVPSSSGKSTIIASTQGNATVPGTDLKLGLNLYRPIK